MLRRPRLTAPLLAFACLVMTWGCAPVAMMPPITTDPTVRQHSGVAASFGAGPVSVAEESPGHVAGGAASVQAWHLRRVNPDLSLGGVFSWTHANSAVPQISAGMLARLHTHEGDRFRLGVDFGIGWAYAMLGMPFAFRVGENVWVYSEPALFLLSPDLVRLPVGVQVELGQKLTLTFEAQIGLLHQSLAMPESEVIPLRGTFSVGVGFNP